jgi:hypothetical protein
VPRIQTRPSDGLGKRHTQHPPLLAAALSSPHVHADVLRLRSAFRFGAGVQCASPTMTTNGRCRAIDVPSQGLTVISLCPRCNRCVSDSCPRSVRAQVHTCVTDMPRIGHALSRAVYARVHAYATYWFTHRSREGHACVTHMPRTCHALAPTGHTHSTHGAGIGNASDSILYRHCPMQRAQKKHRASPSYAAGLKIGRSTPNNNIRSLAREYPTIRLLERC